MNASLIDSIESCQAQLGKRILRLPKNTANVVPRLALHWPAVQTRILIRKLCFLRKCVESVAISGEVLQSMVSSGSTPSLIEQCRFLELPLGTNYTEKIVSYTASEPTPSNKELKRDSLKKTSLIAEVLPWSMHLYAISITSVKIAAGWHCGMLPWSMEPRVHLRRWLFFEPSHNLSLETGDAHCNTSKAMQSWNIFIPNTILQTLSQ